MEEREWSLHLIISLSFYLLSLRSKFRTNYLRLERTVTGFEWPRVPSIKSISVSKLILYIQLPATAKRPWRPFLVPLSCVIHENKLKNLMISLWNNCRAHSMLLWKPLVNLIPVCLLYLWVCLWNTKLPTSFGELASIGDTYCCCHRNVQVGS